MEEEEKKDFFQSPPEYQDRTSRTNTSGGVKKYLPLVIIIAVLAVLLFGAFKMFKGSNGGSAKLTPTPTQQVIPSDTPVPTTAPSGSPTPTEKPTATPKPTVNPIDKASGLDRSKVSIHVLNGNGTVGASKKAADLLEGLGYNVSETANADNFNYDKTVIQVTSDKSDYLALLKKDLSSTYSIGTTSADLAAGSNYQAVVTVGKQ